MRISYLPLTIHHPSPEQYAFAVLAFTGNAYFNRSMRHWAKRNDWSLSDQGLAQAVRSGSGERLVCGASVDCRTEEDVFERLGLQWVPPDRRCCHDGTTAGESGAEAATNNSGVVVPWGDLDEWANAGRDAKEEGQHAFGPW